MTSKQYIDTLIVISAEEDKSLEALEEAAKNARSEHVQRMLNDRKSIVAQRLNDRLDELDKSYLEGETNQ